MASRTAKKSLKKGKGNLYNAAGSPEAGEAMDDTPGFKKGGRAKHKAGGHVEGKEAMHRADHKKRGHHHKRASGGRTPYSSASSTSTPSESGKTDSGHESQRPG